MKLQSILLYPFAILYNLITGVQNRLYDLGMKPSASFDVAVIGVGNLSVGGTGKSPMIEHLIRLLKPGYKVATLSRGYKRKTRGFRLASDKDSAQTLGDEPFQFYRKFKNDVTVTVGEERAMAIPLILDEFPETKVILLDDAFQHRKVKPNFQILLTDYNHPFYTDFILPAGRLRESKYNAGRADVVVVTKCPDQMEEEDMMKVERQIRKYTDKPVFFSTIHYGELMPINGRTFTQDKVILVSGIANAETFKHYVSANFKMIKHFDFADHHQYSEADLRSITDAAIKNQAVVITTEKDAVKLMSDELKSLLSEIPFFYLPIEVDFLKNGKDFDEMVLNAVENV